MGNGGPFHHPHGPQGLPDRFLQPGPTPQEDGPLPRPPRCLLPPAAEQHFHAGIPSPFHNPCCATCAPPHTTPAVPTTHMLPAFCHLLLDRPPLDEPLPSFSPPCLSPLSWTVLTACTALPPPIDTPHTHYSGLPLLTPGLPLLHHLTCRVNNAHATACFLRPCLGSGILHGCSRALPRAARLGVPIHIAQGRIPPGITVGRRHAGVSVAGRHQAALAVNTPYAARNLLSRWTAETALL